MGPPTRSTRPTRPNGSRPCRTSTRSRLARFTIRRSRWDESECRSRLAGYGRNGSLRQGSPSSTLPILPTYTYIPLQHSQVWDLTNRDSHAHMPPKPTFTLHPSFPIRRILWRPSYPCELALMSNGELSAGSTVDLALSIAGESPLLMGGKDKGGLTKPGPRMVGGGGGDAVEVWDVRRGWIAKWAVSESMAESGVTGQNPSYTFSCALSSVANLTNVVDIAFRDSHGLWAQHASGTFSQLDMRESIRPLDAIPRVAATWEASGSVTFVTDRPKAWEAPYDDM
jgi:hypothetical protein